MKPRNVEKTVFKVIIPQVKVEAFEVASRTCP